MAKGETHYYFITIPYYHRFLVEARDEQEALEKAHDEGDGVIIEYDDELAEVECADDVFGPPDEQP